MNVGWLRGLADSGKNTVAQTIADRFRLLKLLEAHTFYTQAKGNPGLVIRMLAYQLARHSPIIAKYMFEAVKDMDVISASMEIQFETLFQESLDGGFEGVRLPRCHHSGRVGRMRREPGSKRVDASAREAPRAAEDVSLPDYQPTGNGHREHAESVQDDHTRPRVGGQP